MLIAEGLVKSFFKGRVVINGLSLVAPEGSLYAVMGESGSGKSTLLAMLGGFLKPDHGKVEFDRKNLYSLSEKEYAMVHKKDIGYIPQGNVLIKRNSIYENIILPHILGGDDTERLDQLAAEYLERLQITHIKDSFPYEVSGGEAKRASIARALLLSPKLVIADEPTTGLDKRTGKVIWDFLSDYARKGNTVIVATHDDAALKYDPVVIDLDISKSYHGQ